uniref:Cadherin domain-containing protein n=1 Tax=Gongylonema pulchrum TaxID=637853 RepID=A0A183EXY1_9BILA
LEYSLMMNSESSALSSLLRVDREGTVRNVEPLLGLEGKYQFAIIARDGKHNGASATIFLTILPASKCQPTFPATVQDVVYVNENEFPGSVLAQFTAEVSSSDCQLTYAIWNGTKYVNETELFMIEPTTGELKAKVSFDCEEQDRHAVREFCIAVKCRRLPKFPKTAEYFVDGHLRRIFVIHKPYIDSFLREIVRTVL